MDIFIQYGLAAAREAIANAGLEVSEEEAPRAGVAIGSGIGGLPMIENNYGNYLKSGPRRISPFFVPGTIINMVSGNLSIEQGFQGPNISVVSACTTGAHNIGMAAHSIAYGQSDIMIAGGAEMTVCPLGIGALRPHAPCPRNTTMSRSEHLGHGTLVATDSCWAPEQASLCWKNTNVPATEGHTSIASW